MLSSSSSLVSFVGFMISVYVAKYYSGISLYLLESFGVGQEISPIFSFAITFILCMIAVWFLAKMISKFFSIISLGWLNGLLGGLFSLLKLNFIASCLEGIEFLVISCKIRESVKPYLSISKAFVSCIFD